MTNKEAIEQLKELRMWMAREFGVEPNELDRELIHMAIEALEAQDHKCENCDHRRNRDFEMYWCNERMMWVDDDMHCTDWSEEE